MTFTLMMPQQEIAQLNVSSEFELRKYPSKETQTGNRHLPSFSFFTKTVFKFLTPSCCSIYIMFVPMLYP